MYVHTFAYRDESYDILCVCDWNQKLSFFQLTGKQVIIFFLRTQTPTKAFMVACESLYFVTCIVCILWTICCGLVE